jgi:hypothetical protein
MNDENERQAAQPQLFARVAIAIAALAEVATNIFGVNKALQSACESRALRASICATSTTASRPQVLSPAT